MKLLSINIGPAKTVTWNDRTFETALDKTAVIGGVEVGALGIKGDQQVEKKHHGGPFRAIYAYPHEHYAHWQKHFNCEPFPFGWFGENLTVTGLDERSVCAGDVYAIGDVHLCVTAPRIPCHKIASRMQDASFVGTFLDSRRTGFYMSVIQEGSLQAGEAIRLLERGEGGLTVCDLTDALFREEASEDLLRRALEAPNQPDDIREKLRKRMVKLYPQAAGSEHP